MTYGIEVQTSEGPLDLGTFYSVKVLKKHTITVKSNGSTLLPTGFTVSKMRLLTSDIGYNAPDLTINTSTLRAVWTFKDADASSISFPFYIVLVP